METFYSQTVHHGVFLFSNCSSWIPSVLKLFNLECLFSNCSSWSLCSQRVHYEVFVFKAFFMDSFFFFVLKQAIMESLLWNCLPWSLFVLKLFIKKILYFILTSCGCYYYHLYHKSPCSFSSGIQHLSFFSLDIFCKDEILTFPGNIYILPFFPSKDESITRDTIWRIYGRQKDLSLQDGNILAERLLRLSRAIHVWS